MTIQPSSITYYTRVSCNIPVPTSDGTLKYHLLDLLPGSIDSSFWRQLIPTLNIAFEELPALDVAAASLSKYASDPGNEYEVTRKILDNLYLNVRLSLSKSRQADISFRESSTLSVDAPTQRKIISNQSLYLARIESEKGLQAFSINDEVGAVNAPTRLLLPSGSSVTIFGQTSCNILTTLSNDDIQTLVDTIAHLQLLLVQDIISRSRKLEADESKAYSYALQALEEYIPPSLNKSDSTVLSTTSDFDNVFYCAGAVVRKESQASNLYTSVSLADCTTEYDALVKLLNVSSVPYRISDPPNVFADNRTYLFVNEDESVTAHVRTSYGYRIISNTTTTQARDGEPHPSGQIITIYPITPDNGGPWSFIKTGLRDANGPLLSVVGISLLLSAATLIPAFLIDQLTSLYIPYGNYYSLVFFGVSAIAVLGITYIIQLLQARYLVRFELITDSNLQTMMVDRFLRIKVDEVASYSPGSLQNRIMGISQLRSTITSNLTPILTAYLSVIFNFIYLFVFSWQLSLVVMVAGALLGTATFCAAQQRLVYFKQLTELDGKLLEYTNDSINGIQVLRSTGTTDELLSRFTKVVKPLISAIFNATRLLNRVDTLSGSTTYILYIFLLPFAYHLSHSGDSGGRVLTIGATVSFLTCTQTFLSSFESAIDKSISSFVQVSTYWSRAMDILHLPAEPAHLESTPKNFDGSLSATNLGFVYPSKGNISNRPVFSGLSFELKPATSNLILGSSRSGKTTLLSVLSALHDTYDGTVTASGHDLNTMSPRIYRSFISNVPQNLVMKQGSLKSNISSGVSVSSDEIGSLLETFGLSQFVDSLPMKLGTVVSPKASSIPVQYKKRLFLLRAALKRSKYVFIDDALSGLPSNDIQKVLNYFTSNGATVLATSSNSSLSTYFDQTFSLDKS